MKAIQLRYKEKENEQQRQNKATPEETRPDQEKKRLENAEWETR
jgi:hypothetical protein